MEGNGVTGLEGMAFSKNNLAVINSYHSELKSRDDKFTNDDRNINDVVKSIASKSQPVEKVHMELGSSL